MRIIRYLLTVPLIAILAMVGMQNNSKATNKVFQKGAAEEIELAKSLSFTYLEQYIADYGIDNIKDLKVLNVLVDDMSMAHTRLQQTYRDIPVIGGQIIVHLNSDGSIFTVTDSLIKGLQVNTQPDLFASEATNIAIAEYGCAECLTSPPEVDMLVLRRKNHDHLVYRVQLHREDDSPDMAMPVYFIDAHTGKKVWSYNNLQSGIGVSLYSGTVEIGTSNQLGNQPCVQGINTYYMEDLIRGIGTFDVSNINTCSRFIDDNDIWDSMVQRAGVDAQFGAEKTYDYFLSTHGRQGMDGIGGPGRNISANGTIKLITSEVHYNMANSRFNGTALTFGDGGQDSFGNMTSPWVSLDIVGHEWTHGVTKSTADLIYSDESGALNESMSDVFGAMVERYTKGESINTWRIGEDFYTPGTPGDALRYMDNPHAALHGSSNYTMDDDPDHYSERYIGTQDSGGVHINSGIPNKVFYLLAKGGTHHLGGSMSGIGADAAASIWYRALTAYMTPNTDFAGARTATLNAAAQLYGTGSSIYNSVDQAWKLCGVGTNGTSAPPNGAAFISQSVPTSMIAGQSYNVSITMKNTGTNTWTSADPYPYRLGSENPTDNLTWGLNRVGLPNIVTNNEQVTFNFTVTAPPPGNYNFQWRMVQEFKEHFGDFSQNIMVNVVDPGGTDDAAYISQSVPSKIYYGTAGLVSVTMQNTGTSTWNPGTYQLASENPSDNTTWKLNRVDLLAPVEPNQWVTFHFYIRPPSTPGIYAFQWRMVKGSTRFGAYSKNVNVYVLNLE